MEERRGLSVYRLPTGSHELGPNPVTVFARPQATPQVDVLEFVDEQFSACGVTAFEGSCPFVQLAGRCMIDL